MDSEKSPSDDHNSFNSDDDLLIDHDQSEDMAVAVAHMPQPFLPPPSSTSPIVQSSTTMNKRYRPAPAKTFQCRGYGECRMVFSRSEHLARHIRKHTGERPFTCHCGKQFSRLDNLRQHAQTVHSDKQDQNERMMHELTSLHATMTAATKGSAPRGKRGQAAATASAGSNNTLDGTLPAMSIKQEDGAHSMSMRPGTSTGYEGGDGEMYHSTGNWSSDIDRVNNHSFRDPGQSFRVPPASATAAAALSHQPHFQRPGQSFLASATFNFSLPDIADHSTGGSRPGTASRPTDRSLPPISTVVPASLPASLALPQPPLLQPPLFVPQQREQHGSSLTSSHVLPLPTPSASYGLHGRRPSTATRPGTAPASYYYGGGNSQSFRPGSGVSAMVAPRPELSLSLATGHGRRPVGLDHGTLYRSYNDNGGEEPTSPVGGPYDSPFSFHAPTSSTPSSATFPAAAPYASSSLANPRKRPYSGSDDGEYDDSRERDRGNDLHRQQEEQMYLRMRREEEAEQRYREQEFIEHQRRKSEEELHQQYLMHLEEYPINTNVTSNNSPSPHGLQYFPQQAYDGDLRHHSSEDLRGHLELGMDGQMYQHHPTQMVAYPLAPLDLQVEGNPTGMIKYESP
ncbi:hypothetical protein EW026_g7280 [Hermanssonia centrifuga]|uniref:C2H2-type domain-containing protein n=1 Tax=Hermanssonia centrifuga TaxID=98765 RepID=A0A4S4K8C3_9APHY|nr:hypothetical protein EW026_g7280 [Hermanssonia centrifuga]